jgi:hypothetical protein
MAEASVSRPDLGEVMALRLATLQENETSDADLTDTYLSLCGYVGALFSLPCVLGLAGHPLLRSCAISHVLPGCPQRDQG